MKKKNAGELEEAKRMIDELRASGLVTISGCSLCSRLVLKKGAKPQPCPFCGALVTRKR